MTSEPTMVIGARVRVKSSAGLSAGETGTVVDVKGVGDGGVAASIHFDGTSGGSWTLYTPEVLELEVDNGICEGRR